MNRFVSMLLLAFIVAVGYAQSVPPLVDWRQKGAVTPVKNQRECGCCWAFAATAAIESHWFIKTGQLVSLSEQNLVDCSIVAGTNGCNYGGASGAFLYLTHYGGGGIDTEQSYPYEARIGECRYNPATKAATIQSYVSIPPNDENALTAAIASVGPVTVSFDANHPSFKNYVGGIYDEPTCSTTQGSHSALAVGYGSEGPGRDYYIIKNSWGKLNWIYFDH